MVKKVISSLVVFCLIVGGISVLQAREGKPGEKTESRGQKVEDRAKLKTQGSNLKAKSKAPKIIQIMNTKSEKMIKEVMGMQIEEQGKGEEKYLSCTFHTIYPAWSPDNKKVAYVLIDGTFHGVPIEGGQIWIRDLATMDDAGVLIKTWEYGYATELDFSPDGKQIICVIKGQAWKMDIDGKNKVQLTNFKKIEYEISPKWSPDGKKILLAFAGGDIHLINPDGSGYTIIPTPIKGGGNWSPDGKKIVFMKKENNRWAFNLWVINSDGTNPIQLTTDGNVDPDYIPSWSPRGNKIAYTIEGDEKCPYYIMIINTDGSNPTKLLLPNNWIGTNPVWSKDGKKLLIVAMKDITHPLSKREPIYATGLYILTLPESVLK